MNDAKKAAAPGRLHRSALNAASGLAGWVIPVLINVVTAPVLLHHLGAEGYGVLSLGALLVGYFAIADMGLDIAVVKYVAEFDAQGEKDELNRLLSASMQINFVIGLLGLAVALMLAPYLSERVFAVPTSLQSQAVTVFRLAGAGFFASMVISWGSAIIQGLQRYDLLNVLSAANNGVGVMAGLAAVLAGYGVVGFMAMRVLTSFCVGLCYIVAARRLLPNLKLQFGIDPRAAALIRRVAGFGVLLRVTGMVSVMSDRTLIGIWLGTAAVAWYSIPSLVATGVSQIVSKTMNFLFPMSSELAATGRSDDLRAIAIRIFRFVFAAGVALCVPLIVLADKVLLLWVGADVAAHATEAMRILLFASLLSTSGVLTGSVVPGLGHFGKFTAFTVGKALLIASLLVVLIPVWAIPGAAVAILAGSLADFGFALFSVRRHLQISIPELLRVATFEPVMLGIGLAVVTALLHGFANTWRSLALVGALSELLFIVGAFAIGLYGDTERRAVSLLVGSLRSLTTFSSTERT